MLFRSYIWLMKQHNGGIPVNTCYPCDEPTCWAEDHVAITGIFGIGREKSCSLCGELGSQFMIDEGSILPSVWPSATAPAPDMI